MAHFNPADYQTVQERIDLLRKNFPECRTVVEIAHLSETDIIVRAFVYLTDDPEAAPACVDLAHEVKDASPVNRTSWVENAATSALGRAISQLGGVYSPKGKKPSREEMQKVARAQKPAEPVPAVEALVLDGFRAQLAEANNLDALNVLWVDVIAAGAAQDLRDEFTARKEALK